VCFPYAGGGASVFQDWASLLPRTFEVAVRLQPCFPAHLSVSARKAPAACTTSATAA
jgi:surfactin synthase thioesterase subunit